MNEMTTMNRYRHLLLAIVFAALAVVGQSAVRAQSWNMVASDTVFIDACTYHTGTIYDDGGPTGNYSNYFNGWVVITANAGVSITLTGEYATESATYDWIDVWDGDVTTGTQLVYHTGGTGSLPAGITATSGRMTIKFRSDGSVVNTGFALNYSLTGSSLNGLTVSAVTDSSAALSWSTAEPGPYHVLLDDHEVGVTSAMSYTLSGLYASRRYNVTVYPDGQANNRCMYMGAEFRTPCGITGAPLVEDFNDMTAELMPPCWTKSTNFDELATQPRLIDMGAEGNALMVSCGGNNTAGHYGMVISPVIAEAGTQWTVAFDYRVSHSNTVLVVGVCDSVSPEYEYYGFTPLESLNVSNTNDWQHYREVHTIPAGGCRLAIRMIQSSQSGVGRMAYIDNISMEDCGINEAWTSQTDTTSVKLSWTLVASPTVSVGVRREGMAVDDTVIANAVSPLVVDNLLPGTSYTLRLYPECDGAYGLTYAVSVHTIATTDIRSSLCENVIDTAPNYQYVLREGWVNGSTGYDQIYVSSSYISMYNGTYLVTPPIADLGGKQVSLEYYSGNNYVSYYYGNLIVGTMIYADDFSTFTPFDTIDSLQHSRWVKTEVEVPAGCTDRFVAFLYQSPNGNYGQFRNFSVNGCQVKGERITAIHSDSVSVAWDAPSTSEDTVLVGYRYSTTVPFSYDTVVEVTQHTLTGLNPDNDVYIRVRRSCMEECNLSDWRIHTPRRPQFYCENFDGSYSTLFGSYGSKFNWYKQYTNNSCPDTSTRHSHSGARSIKMETNSGHPLLLPYIDSVGGKVLSFWAFSLAPSSRILVSSAHLYNVYEYSNPPFDSYYFDTVDIVGDSRWHHYSVTLPDTLTERVALKYQLVGSSNQGIYNLWLDDVQLGPCGYGDFTFANLTANSVDVVCQSVGATAVRVRLTGGGTIIDTIGVPDTIHISGLDSNTRYSCYVAPIVGDDTLCLSYASSFLTPGFSMYIDLIPACNPFDQDDVFPQGWIFSDSTAITIANGTMRVNPGASPDTISLPPFMAAALYIAARGLSGSDTLFVDGDTTVLDTVWRHYCFVPSTVPGHRVALRIATGSATGGCLLDNVGFSDCPVVDFTPEGNSLRCQVRGGYDSEYLLTLTDDDAIDRSYHVDQSNYLIEDLPPSTHFLARWQCLYRGSGCMPTVDVQTAGVSLPYCIDFAENNDDLPDGWKWKIRGSDYYYVYNTYRYFYSSYNYSYNPQYYKYNRHWSYIILPEVEDYTSLSVVLNVSLSADSLQIGMLTNPADTATFVSAATFMQGDIQPFETDLSQMPHGRVAIRFMAGGVNLYKVLLMDAPMITPHLYRHDSLTLEVAYNDDYALEYLFNSNSSSTNINYSSASTVVADTSFFNISAYYNGSSSYRYLHVRQLNADGESGCFSPLNTINVHLAKTLPYCQDFQSGSNYEYQFAYHRSSGFWTRSSTYNSETNGYDYYLYDYISSRRFISFPYFLTQSDSAGRLSAQFRYRYVASSGTASKAELVAGVLVDAIDSGSFVPVDTLALVRDGEWHTAVVDFAPYGEAGGWLALSTRYYGEYYYLYLDDIRVENCLAAFNATATIERYNVVRIDNTKDEKFYVEYGPQGFVRGTGTLTAVDSTPYHLVLAPETDYEFYFYCDSTGAPCAKSQQVSTLAPPLDVPTCVDFDTCTVNQGPAFWTRVTGAAIVSDTLGHSTGNSLMVLGTVATPDINIDSLQEIGLGLWVMTTVPGTRLMVGSMSTPSDVATFHNLKTIVPEQVGVWEHHFVSFANAPANAHFIALRNSAGDSRTLFVDDLHFTTCAAFDLHVDHLDNNTIDLSWSRVGAPSISFTVDDDGMPSAYTPMADTLSIPITPLHGYTIAMHSACASTLACNVDYDDTIHIVAPVEGTGCVNSTDLRSPQAVFYSGSYQNPYSVAGAVDRGSRSPDSRHTVCYDTTERDPRTGGLLRTIPEGYTSSVRLGNWNTNITAPEAEGVIYSLMVDTTSFNLLMMRYAAVLQDPMHAASDQPRFRLELLDSAFNLIDPVCAAADFIANRNLGWNEASDNVLWKDWTPVGIDVSAYAGQQVYVRLTTYDCNEGSHYGYAYFTLECMRKTIDAETCGNVDSNRFTAPAGFNYRWYTATSPATISTERTLVVPTAAMATYFCDLSFVGNASCSFTLSAFGGPRLPLARVDTTVTITDCHFDVQFTNTSTVSPDGITPAPTNEQVESVYWDFGNGETSNSYHGHTVYDTIGTYTVTLIVGISGGQCTDTLIWPMRVEPPTWPYIVGPDSLCDGIVDTLRLYGGTPYNDTLWSNGGDHWYLPISPANYQLGANSYSLLTTDPYGCHPPASHTLTVSPVYQFYDTVHICGLLLPYTYRDTTFLEGTVTGNFDFHHHSMAGCDSNYHLWLWVDDTSASIIRDTVVSSICDNESYSFRNTTYTVAGTYNIPHADATGMCDSIHTLQLDVRATSVADTTVNVCDSFTWYDSTYAFSTSTPTHVIPNSVGCDSTTTLQLTVRHSSMSTVDEVVLENQLPYTFHGSVFTSDTVGAIVTIPNAVNCDSLITYSLSVHWNTLTELDSTICADRLPLSWNNVTFIAAGVLDDTLTGQYGEDSVVRMTLYVNPVYDDTLSVSICDNQSQPFADSSYAIQGVYTRLLSTVAGCDSLCTLDLVVRKTSVEDTVAVVCDSIVWHGNTYTVSADSLTALVGLNQVACDSTLRMSLTVHYSAEVNDSHIFCPGYPFLYMGVDYGGPTAFDTVLSTREHCDSLVHVFLLERDSSYRLLPLFRFDSTDWQMPDSVLKSCDPALLELRDSTPGAVAWNWTCFMADTQLVSVDSTFTVTVDTGQYTMKGYVNLIVTDTLGCYDTVGWPLFVFKSSVPEFHWHPDVPAMHNPEALFVNLTWPDTATYLWRIQQMEGGAFDTTSEANPFYHWGEEGDNMVGEYTVRLIASWPHTVDSFRVDTVQWIDSTLHNTMLYETFTHTCIDSVEHIVVITNDYLQFPNLVSPNGDGINDKWVIVNLIEFGNYSMNELWIYDRTGAQVYHAKNIHRMEQFWDPNATHSPDGTYYYRFTAKGEYGIVKRNGLIEVVR